MKYDTFQKIAVKEFKFSFDSIPKGNQQQGNETTNHTTVMTKDDTKSSEEVGDESDENTVDEEDGKEKTAEEENEKEETTEKKEIEKEKDDGHVEKEQATAYNISTAYMLNEPPPTYNDLLGIDLDHIKVPTNLNILFLGDSILRYQYLSLAHFLAYGKWVQNDENPNLLIKHTHGGSADFFNFTYTKLFPYEFLCDCFRFEKDSEYGWHDFLNNYALENRYFYDPARNNSVVYLQKFGNWPHHSTYNVSDVNHMRNERILFDDNSKNGEDRGAHQGQKKLVTDGKEIHQVINDRSWANFITDFVCKLDPKPSLVFYNQGLWPHKGFDRPDTQNEILTAFKSCDIKSVYKTTTRRKDDKSTDVQNYEKEICAKSDYCFDRSWTGLVPEELYQDNTHFMPIVNNWINVLLMDFLSMEGTT